MTPDPARTADLDRLVEAVLDGDRVALDRLLALLRPLVLRYCRARTARTDPHAAEDVAQDVLLAVLRALPGYTDEGKPFLAFVYGIAAHKCVDAVRRRSRGAAPTVAEPDPETPDHGPGPEDLALRGARRQLVHRLLDELPARQREILVLRLANGLSAEETAQAVGSTPGAVRVAQHRALARLRPLAPVEEEDELSDWAAAPLTGDPELDRLLGVADAALRRRGGVGRPGG
ncbi:RNA polymerase sigma factor ShbA [Actinomycetospora cinnamomea]|uniref:RNA polymerase sigma-70 factor (ECF subfamily) n=1 Tax=Actinomycetospora cinnamomea TaxID=663609 RepID=A0A2U1F6X9_9PSEU|nr:RNA polymerase sigma-70 factor (ECF subfamily) [Actinomycetospora cinnamomea]